MERAVTCPGTELGPLIEIGSEIISYGPPCDNPYIPANASYLEYLSPEAMTVNAFEKGPSPWFTDEEGNPSARSGPDLQVAEPIDQVVAYLRRLRSCHAVPFYQACRASGIDLSVVVDREGEEQLYMGAPMDSQADLRKARCDALVEHLNSTLKRYRGVVELVNILGYFRDNRPFASTREAAREFLANGGRIMVRPDGGLEESVSSTRQTSLRDSWEGFPRRRAWQRYASTLRQAGTREAMTELVRMNGSIHHESGWLVWESVGETVQA